MRKAAANAGVPFTLSTLSTCSIEEVRAVSEGRLWFQVYAWRDRGLVKEMVDRAAAARYEALMLTVDERIRRVELLREYRHPNDLLSTSQGNVQILVIK